MKKRIQATLEPRELAEVETGDSAQQVVQLQLAMATSSINHEYARIEYDETRDEERKEELLEYMNVCRQKYFEARGTLETFDPHALREFEIDLMQQKQETLQNFNA